MKLVYLLALIPFIGILGGVSFANHVHPVNVRGCPDGVLTVAAHAFPCENCGPGLLRFLLACEPDCL